MRKLGILIATVAVAALGLVGFAASPASADGHEGTLCPAFTGNPIYENMDSDPTPGAAGQPLKSTLEGAQESCETSNSGDGLHPSPLLCGIAEGINQRPGPELEPLTGDPDLGSATVGSINDALAEDFPEDLPVKFNACGQTTPEGGGPTPPGPKGNGGGDTEVAPQVLANNAAADGGMPRTGGELFAGAGFALASLGALIRRFIG